MADFGVPNWLTSFREGFLEQMDAALLAMQQRRGAGTLANAAKTFLARRRFVRAREAATNIARAVVAHRARDEFVRQREAATLIAARRRARRARAAADGSPTKAAAPA